MSGSVLYDAPGPKTRRRSAIASVVSALALVAAGAWIIATLAAPRVAANGAETPGMFDASRWDIALDPLLWENFGRGVLATLAMASVAAVLAVLFGVLLSFARTARSMWVRVPAAGLLEFVRGMPVLLMIFFVFLVFSTGAYWAGVLGLAVYNGAIIGEALRAGIVSLPKGQGEAGYSLGLTPLQTRLSIEFPQAFRQMLPIIIAQLVVLLKDTSLAYVVGYNELARTIKNLQNALGNRYLFTLFIIGLLIYLIMNLTLSWLARVIAKRSGPKLGKVTPDDVAPVGSQGTQAITMVRRNRGKPPG